MTVRLRYRIEVSFSSSTNEEKDLGNGKFEVVADGLGEGGMRKTTVAASTTNQEVQLGDVATAKFLFIRTASSDPTEIPARLDFRRNSISGEVIPVVPLPLNSTTSTREGHLLLSTVGLTSLFVSNDSSVDMEITVGVGGD